MKKSQRKPVSRFGIKLQRQKKCQLIHSLARPECLTGVGVNDVFCPRVGLLCKAIGQNRLLVTSVFISDEFTQKDSPWEQNNHFKSEKWKSLLKYVEVEEFFLKAIIIRPQRFFFPDLQALCLDKGRLWIQCKNSAKTNMFKILKARGESTFSLFCLNTVNPQLTNKFSSRRMFIC